MEANSELRATWQPAVTHKSVKSFRNELLCDLPKKYIFVCVK